MKGIRLLPLALVLCAGCFHLPMAEPEAKPEPPRPAATPPKPVTADQVTPTNAGHMVNALQQEMDRAANP